MHNCSRRHAQRNRQCFIRFALQKELHSSTSLSRLKNASESSSNSSGKFFSGICFSLVSNFSIRVTNTAKSFFGVFSTIDESKYGLWVVIKNWLLSSRAILSAKYFV